MGALNAAAMGEAVADGGLSLRQALDWHLSSNHYPPVPPSMIDPCVDAIQALDDDEADLLITLPEGVSYRGGRLAPAWAIVEAHHLDAFLDTDRSSQS